MVVSPGRRAVAIQAAPETGPEQCTPSGA